MALCAVRVFKGGTKSITFPFCRGRRGSAVPTTLMGEVAKFVLNEIAGPLRPVTQDLKWGTVHKIG